MKKQLKKVILVHLMALALVRHRFRGRRAANFLILIPMATPEVVIGAPGSDHRLLDLAVALCAPGAAPGVNTPRATTPGMSLSSSNWRSTSACNTGCRAVSTSA